MSGAELLTRDFAVRAARGAEMEAAFALRRAVFVAEQGVFARDDRDAVDAVALPLVALAGARVVGTVRIHEAGPGVWWGSRLAVAADHRRVGRLGAELIRLAVGTARARGATSFHAHVQRRNAALFRRLHWHIEGEAELHGRPHLSMSASLAHYAPVPDPATGWRLAAPGGGA
ncbi:MSMEG_0567/Sll0786 family nitrogen starvation N-acetyltransferase [Amaricoccus solimangrovi]|uniref:GNAT family N-acetyltransferase n=1 Tax=Amaricoccus solimangrovi TaxID=2589815 RepID=A0A501WZU3_9RHOB|nr:MSMEG_0567/Sll0786 family nitrogen starvation N-acetyltransferase [Amaricoccus solimangrovi]TPE51696.1 GNAT family N-acetyltransferase [Amaricoccus solimangrovi]